MDVRDLKACTGPTRDFAMFPPSITVFTTIDEVIMANAGTASEGMGSISEDSLALAEEAGVGEAN